ncbi:MAG TPA: hypothetical protein VF043_07725 [Ktedonobacteraceae bacterium]
MSERLHEYWVEALKHEHKRYPEETGNQYGQRIDHLAFLAIEQKRPLLPLVEQRLREEREDERASRPMSRDEIAEKAEQFKAKAKKRGRL